MTQIEQARKGNVTPSLKKVADEEGVAPEKLLNLVAQGKVVIPHNPNHSPIHPVGIGQKLSTKVNVNIGTSMDFPQEENELKKVEISLKYGTDTLMDLSTSSPLSSEILSST